MSSKQPIVGIVVKPAHPRALELTLEVLKWLKDRKVEMRLDSEIAGQLEPAALNGVKTIERNRITNECDPIVVLGGDGTLLSVCRHPSSSGPTIVGVNLGTLGFLTEITADEMFPVLESVFSGKAKAEKRYLMKVELVRAGRKTERFFAFNDIVITKPTLARIIGTEYFVDDQFAATVHGDGLIIATPGGSTAYSLSAGGSIVHPQVSALLVTPICPHSLTSRPLVIPGSSTIRLRLAPASRDEQVTLTVDGQEGIQIVFGDEVTVATSDRFVQFAKFPQRNYFQILATKLKWANV